jgi:hypothetical protein
VGIFKGRLSLSGDATSIPAEMEVANDRVVIRARGLVIGDWPRSELGISSGRSGVIIHAEGEELQFTTTTSGLSIALGLTSATSLTTRFQEAAEIQPTPTEQRLWRWPIVNAAAVLGVFVATGVIAALAMRGNPDSQAALTTSTTSVTASTALVVAPTSTTVVEIATPTTLEPTTTSTSPTTTSTSPTTTVPAVTAPPPTTTTAPPAAPTTQAPRNLTTIGNGTWLVGSDIQAGTWETFGSVLAQCVWARLSGPDFLLQNFIEIGGGPGTGGNSTGTVRVNVQPSDAAFYTNGCGTWKRIG